MEEFLPLLVQKIIIRIYLECDSSDTSYQVKRNQIRIVSRNWLRYISTFTDTLYVYYSNFNILQEYLNHFHHLSLSSSSSPSSLLPPIINPESIKTIKFIDRLQRSERYRTPSSPLPSFDDEDSKLIITFLNTFPNTKALYLFNNSNISTTFIKHLLNILKSGSDRLRWRLEKIEYIDEHAVGEQLGYLPKTDDYSDRYTFLNSIQHLDGIVSLSYLNYKHQVNSNSDLVYYLKDFNNGNLESLKLFGRFGYFGKFDTTLLIVPTLGESLKQLKHLDLGLVHIWRPKQFITEFLYSLPATLESLSFGQLKIESTGLGETLEQTDEIHRLLADYLRKVKLKSFSTRFELSALEFESLSQNEKLELLDIFHPDALVVNDIIQLDRTFDFSKTSIKRLTIRTTLVNSLRGNISHMFELFKNVTTLRTLSIPQDALINEQWLQYAQLFRHVTRLKTIKPTYTNSSGIDMSFLFSNLKKLFPNLKFLKVHRLESRMFTKTFMSLFEQRSRSTSITIGASGNSSVNKLVTLELQLSHQQLDEVRNCNCFKIIHQTPKVVKNPNQIFYSCFL